MVTREVGSQIWRRKEVSDGKFCYSALLLGRIGFKSNCVFDNVNVGKLKKLYGEKRSIFVGLNQTYRRL